MTKRIKLVFNTIKTKYLKINLLDLVKGFICYSNLKINVCVF